MKMAEGVGRDVTIPIPPIPTNTNTNTNTNIPIRYWYCDIPTHILSHFHPELHGNFCFFFINTAVRYDLLDKFHSKHSACFKFLSFRRACMLLYVRKSQRISPQANRNEKLVPNVSFPKILELARIFVLLLYIDNPAHVT